MNKLDVDYQNLLKDILENGVSKNDRTGTGTLSVFGRQIRHNMSAGFPVLTTKKMAFKTMVVELLWFLRGSTNIQYLVKNGCHIWDGDAYKAFHSKFPETEMMSKQDFIETIRVNDEFAAKHGNLGPIYGKQWRDWEPSETHSYGCIDQITNLINELKTNPDSRRMIVSAWNVGDLSAMILPPCHYAFQIYTRELSESERVKVLHERYGNKGSHIENGFDVLDELNIPTRTISLMFNMRSIDTMLGLPFNIASYGLLLEIIAKEVNMVPDQLIGNLGDVHLYNNHIEQAKEQITRTPYELPKLVHMKTDEFYKSLSEDSTLYHHLDVGDFTLENYQSHPAIKAPLSN
jgi:thymidylate synthase